MTRFYLCSASDSSPALAIVSISSHFERSISLDTRPSFMPCFCWAGRSKSRRKERPSTSEVENMRAAPIFYSKTGHTVRCWCVLNCKLAVGDTHESLPTAKTHVMSPKLFARVNRDLHQGTLPCIAAGFKVRLRLEVEQVPASDHPERTIGLWGTRLHPTLAKWRGPALFVQ